MTGSNGGKTVTVVFSKPFGDWQSLFSDLMPAHIAKTVGFNNGFQTFNAAVKVSGGPFEIQSYTQGQSLIEVPNPKWFGAAPKLSKLVFRFFADDNQIPPAMQNSEVDAANPAQASLQFKDAVAAVPNVTTTIIPGLQFQHMDFNQANPYLAKLDVRLAIAAGTNRNEMVQRIVGPITTSVKPLNNRIYMPTQPQFTGHQRWPGRLQPDQGEAAAAIGGDDDGVRRVHAPELRPAGRKGPDPLDLHHVRRAGAGRDRAAVPG